MRSLLIVVLLTGLFPGTARSAINIIFEIVQTTAGVVGGTTELVLIVTAIVFVTRQ